jgi:hypothetical protein
MAKEEIVAHESKFNKLKLAFLYVLIGGLVVSALISVSAILVGEFNSAIQKALLTTFVLVVHSLLVLAIVSADTQNRLGKSLLTTVILGSVLANMFTSTFGIWQLWGDGASWNAFHIYMLLIGAAFLVSAVLKLRIAHKLTTIMTYVTVGLITLLTLLFVPWIIADSWLVLDAFYYRAVGAAGILAATSLVITAIVNRIAVGQKAALRVQPKHAPIPGGMLAIYINVGIIVAFFWLYGFFAFMIEASQNNTPQAPAQPYYDYRY